MRGALQQRQTAPPHLQPPPIRRAWKYIPLVDWSQDPEDIREQPDLQEFLDKVCNDEARYRRYHLYRCARNLWAYRGRQWIDTDARLLATSSNGYRFQDISWRSDRPNPVVNKLATAWDNECARLERKEYQPSTPSSSAEEKAQAASRLAQQIMLYEIREQMWGAHRAASTWEFVGYGTTVARCYADESGMENGDVMGAEDAARCPGCGQVFQSRSIPVAAAEATFSPATAYAGSMPTDPQELQHRSTWNQDPDSDSEAKEAQLQNCPFCEEPTPLVDYHPTPEEAADPNKVDFLGRPLGYGVPFLRPRLEHVPLEQAFFESGGFGIEPHTCSIWGQASIVDLDTIASRWPHCADWLKPDSPEELMRHTLTMGDFAHRLGGAFDSESVFPCHARLKEVHVDPRPGVRALIPGPMGEEVEASLEYGLSIWSVNGKILNGLPLVIRVPGQQGKPERRVKRVTYAAGRYKRIPGEMYGRTPVDDLFPVQQHYNRVLAMQEDADEKGFPRIFVPPGVEVYERPGQGALSVVEVQADVDNFDPKSLMMPSATITGDPYETRLARLEQQMQELFGPAPIELGQTSADETATGIQIKAEQLEQGRSPRERTLKEDVFEVVLTALMDQTAVLKTRAEGIVERSAGAFSVQSYETSLLEDHVDVRLEAQGNLNRTIFEREGVGKALASGLYGALETQSERDKALELQGLPLIPNSKSLQVRLAEGGWEAWIEALKLDEQADPVPPVYDPVLYDAPTWYGVLGSKWLNDDAQRFMRERGWSVFLDAIVGWPGRLANAEAIDAQQRQIYGALPPEQWEAHYQQLAQQAQQAAVQAAQQQAVMDPAADPSMAPPPPEQPIPPPQAGMFLPEGMEERLLFLWQQDIARVPPPLPVDGAPLGPQQPGVPGGTMVLVRMYALIMACWWRREQQVAAQQPQEAPGAPGTPQPAQ